MPLRRNYAPVVFAKSDDYRGAALIGAHSASIAWNFEDEALRDGLMGFGVKRSDYDPDTRELLRTDWLMGQLRFETDDDDTGTDVRSFEAPFQRFRWSDYTLNPDLSYLYEVFPIRGEPGALTRDEKPLQYWIRPSPVELDGTSIYVNRGVTAAFAYLDRFKLQHPKDVPNDAAFHWLSRGLKESILDFIEGVADGEALHLCIYEFFDDDIARALNMARRRGVDIEIIYHGKENDHTTEKNEETIARARLKSVATPRRLSGHLCHNKFLVHLRGGEAVSVHTGTANFSENAFHFQTNAAIKFDLPFVAAAYEEYFQILRSDPARSRRRNDETDVRFRVFSVMERINAHEDKHFETSYFSPLRTRDIVEAAVSLVESAESCVFVSSPFALDNAIVEALGGNSEDILEYGLANSTAKKKIAALNRKNTRFFTPTRLETYMGRAWDSKAFGNHKIHAKMIAIDPWGDEPKLLFGSANFSDGSCTKNDENAFLAIGDKRLTAVLTTEFLRMFDHYKSRAFINQIRSGGRSEEKRFLSEDGKWMNTAFRANANSHKFRDRIVFAGG